MKCKQTQSANSRWEVKGNLQAKAILVDFLIWCQNFTRRSTEKWKWITMQANKYKNKGESVEGTNEFLDSAQFVLEWKKLSASWLNKLTMTEITGLAKTFIELMVVQLRNYYK